MFSSKKFKEKFWTNTISAIIVIVYLNHVNFMVYGIKAFACIDLGDPDHPSSYLRADPEVECYEPHHLILSIVSILIYCIFIPILLPLYY